MTIVDATVIAARLGLPEGVVRAVQRRGVLLRLDLDDTEIRERLWRAHCSSSDARGQSVGAVLLDSSSGAHP